MTKRRTPLTKQEIQNLLDEILLDAYGDDEQLWAFRQAFEDEVERPVDAFVVGQPVEVVLVDYDGNERRGLTARCRNEGGELFDLALIDVVFPEDSGILPFLAAYRSWLGLEPLPKGPKSGGSQVRHHRVSHTEIDMAKPVELVVVSVKDKAARCALPGTTRRITLRAGSVWNLVPGEIVTVAARKQWKYGGHPYLSGEVVSFRLDVEALGLVPLGLEDCGMWDPADEYWGEEGEPLEEWAREIIGAGPRPEFEMEQVIPGQDPDDWDNDPICEAGDWARAKNHPKAREILMGLLDQDLRCLDAYAHLGNLEFDLMAELALRFYQAGVAIGQLSLVEDFSGLLPWGWVDNRPYLRCLQGKGLCLWRLGRFEEAQALFEKMLWLNPSDNQGIRFLLPDVRARAEWRE